MSVDPLATPVSTPALAPSPITGTPGTPKPLTITTLEELGSYLRAGGSLTDEQKSQIMQSIQNRMNSDVTTHQQATEGIQRIDYETEFRSNGLRNVAVFDGDRFRRVDPSTITEDFARAYMKSMAIITRDGVVKPASREVADRLAIGSSVEIENPDGTRETVKITKHLEIMTEDELREFESAILSHIQKLQLLRQRVDPTRQEERISHNMSLETFRPSETRRSHPSQPPMEFVHVNVVGARRECDRSDQVRNQQERAEQHHQVNRHRIHLELVEDESRENIQHDEHLGNI